MDLDWIVLACLEANADFLFNADPQLQRDGLAFLRRLGEEMFTWLELPLILSVLLACLPCLLLDAWMNVVECWMFLISGVQFYTSSFVTKAYEFDKQSEHAITTTSISAMTSGPPRSFRAAVYAKNNLITFMPAPQIYAKALST